ncbi:cupin domain-containing protein [Halonotius terrestris]|uniref:Cupin domain-containing protein n=1 Tax=Halonotius terrestris TaxID=2487750 RepID=A0A8J8PB08_9EURY|nr:cupin domain-containing protein [Halonotius terrestris]TQQ83095.1 cupin domain-containing protein [Halonotius terrestris]
MNKVRIDALDDRSGPADVARPITNAIGAESIALNYYELAPGESFAYGYHKHETQEEVFVIQQGEVTFEMETGEVTVEAGDVIRFAPGEFQRGVNTGEQRVIALALGAPQARGDTEIRRECADCGERTPTTVERIEGGSGTLTRCLECGAETGRFE